MTQFTIRTITTADRSWLATFMVEHWGATAQAVRGALFYPHELPGFVAEQQGAIVGVATYRQLDDATCELATLNSLQSGLGIGTALVQAVADVARQKGCTQVVVVTTNDNLHALRFYQRQGFVFKAVRIEAVNEARRTLKAEIPLLSDNGIPIRDEIELVLTLKREEQA